MHLIEKSFNPYGVTSHNNALPLTQASIVALINNNKPLVPDSNKESFNSFFGTQRLPLNWQLGTLYNYQFPLQSLDGCGNIFMELQKHGCII